MAGMMGMKQIHPEHTLNPYGSDVSPGPLCLPIPNAVQNGGSGEFTLLPHRSCDRLASVKIQRFLAPD